jgi:chromosome partitioning protein
MDVCVFVKYRYTKIGIYKKQTNIFLQKYGICNSQILLNVFLKGRKVMGKSTSVINQKGGVGKTTVTVNLSVATSISYKEAPVLLIDLDPQGHATKAVRNGDKQNLKAESIALFNDEHVEPMKVRDNLYLIGANKKLGGANSMPPAVMFDFVNQVKKYKEEGYTIFIDNNPTNHFLQVSGCLVSEAALIITEAEVLSFDSMADIISDIEKIKKQNSSLDIIGYVLNKVKRRKVSKDLINALHSSFQDDDDPFVLEIPDRVVVSDSYAKWKSVCEYAPKDEVTKRYFQLAKMVHDKLYSEIREIA